MHQTFAIAGISIGVVSLLLLAISLASPILSAVAARSKGYSGLLWFSAGLLFGPLALIALCAMPTRISPFRKPHARRIWRKAG
jgi:hypothetical protein